jgi:hypothetical protein
MFSSAMWKGVEMKVAHLLIVVLLLAPLAAGQNPDCRQSWMAADAPAFCAWEKEPPLPEARTYPAVATSDKYIYTLGGFRFDAASSQVIYYDSVVRSTIGANGHLSAWAAEPSFKNARSGAAAVSAGKCLFLAGGSSSTPTSLNYYDDTQYARIGSDGRLSPWATSPSRLKTPRSNHSLAVVTTGQGTFLNAVAGVTQIGADTVHLDTIEVAKVNADCTVGEWKLANFHLKGGRSSPQALVVRNNVVVIGGWGDLDLLDIYNDVQIAAPRADGSPSPWRTSPGRLTTGIYGHATVHAEPEQQPGASLLLSVAGQPSTGAYANWLSYAYVLPGVAVPDAIGVWRISPTGRLPTGRAGLGAAQSRARLYVIGGNDASGQYYSEVLSARFDFGRP